MSVPRAATTLLTLISFVRVRDPDLMNRVASMESLKATDNMKTSVSSEQISIELYPSLEALAAWNRRQPSASSCVQQRDGTSSNYKRDRSSHINGGIN